MHGPTRQAGQGVEELKEIPTCRTFLHDPVAVAFLDHPGHPVHIGGTSSVQWAEVWSENSNLQQIFTCSEAVRSTFCKFRPSVAI